MPFVKHKKLAPNMKGRGSELKSFVVIRTKHVNENLKFQNVQLQLCYHSQTTIPSNGKSNY